MSLFRSRLSKSCLTNRNPSQGLSGVLALGLFGALLFHCAPPIQRIGVDSAAQAVSEQWNQKHLQKNTCVTVLFIQWLIRISHMQALLQIFLKSLAAYGMQISFIYPYTRQVMLRLPFSLSADTYCIFTSCIDIVQTFTPVKLSHRM